MHHNHHTEKLNPETLKHLIEHLLKHNKDHKTDLNKWKEKASHEGFDSIIGDLEQINMLYDQISQLYQSIIDKI